MDGAFIGLSDIEEESVFVWSDGSPLGFAQWAPNEPNDSGDEDAGVMLGPPSAIYGKWNDFHAGATLPFVCERKRRTLQGKVGRRFLNEMISKFV